MRTKVFHTGDGTTREYDVTFPFIDRDHVKVSVDGVDQAITWITSSRVQIATAPAVGAEVELYRETPLDDRLVDFTDGTVLTAADMDLADTQLFYNQQELDDLFGEISTNTLRSPSAVNELPDASSRIDKVLTFDGTGQPEVTSKADLADELVSLVPLNITTAAGASVSSRSLLAAIASPVDEQTAYLSEAGQQGWFTFRVGDYSAEVAADADGSRYIPQSGLDGSAGAWVRDDNREVKTPIDFGAVPYNPLAEVDSTVALQAFFDFFRDPDNSRRYVGDWSGEWLVSDTIWANFAAANDDATGPVLISGTLRVAPLADLPGGEPLEVVLEAIGYEMNWLGEIGIFPSGPLKWGANTVFEDRRFEIGVRIRTSNGSKFGAFRIYDAMRDAVLLDSNGQGVGGAHTYTVRAGTPQETVYPNSNCIGTQLGPVNARTYGSHHKSASKYGFKRAVSAKLYGTNSGTWVASGGANSLFQRTRMTVSSTENMRVGDMGKMRHEIDSSVYGTIAIDATAKTVTWSAGDPVAAGLKVGDIYYIENTDSSTVNEQIALDIVGFSGVSNRVIQVWPRPAIGTFTTQAARDTLKMVSIWTYHTIRNVVDATTIEVFPWVPSRHNTDWHHVAGAALRILGADAAFVTCPSVKGLIGAIGLAFDGLYGPEVTSVGLDFGEIGIRIGNGGSSSTSLGLKVDHVHAEGTTWHVFNHSSGASYDITGTSALRAEGITTEGPRTGNNDLFVGSGTFGSVRINTSDQTIMNPHQTRFEGTHGSGGSVYAGDAGYYLSNDTRYRQRFVHTDTATVEVRYNYHLAANFAGHHWAELVWTDSDGSSPDGTLTLNLHQELIDKGWTFAGGGSGTSFAISGVTANVVVRFQFLQATKKVAVTVINGA